MSDMPTTRNPRDWALYHIRPYVERGDTVTDIADSWHGRAIPAHLTGIGIAVVIKIGADLWFGETPKGYGFRHKVPVRRGEIGVLITDDARQHETGVYRLADLHAEIRSGASQLSLMGATP